MLFLRRSLVGLFLFSVTLGLMAWAGGMFWGALQERLNREAQVRPARERVVGVNVIEIIPATVTPVLTAFGEIRSRRTLELRASAAGRVIALAESFEDGGEVRAGQVLARIDPTDAEAALELARTDLAEAEDELRDARTALTLARDELAGARSQAELRTQALTRQRDLQTRGIGSAAAVEEAALQASSAEQSVLSQRQAVATAESRVDQAGNALSRQHLNVAEAERALADTELRAGFDGIMAEVTAVEGGLVTENEILGQLIDPDALEVAFRVSTSQYARLLDESGSLIDLPIAVSLDVMGEDLSVAGTISRVSAQAGEGLTGRLIFARLERIGGFRPGDFVTVRVEEPELPDMVVLPAAAVSATGEVLVVGADNRLDVAQVQIARRQGNEVIVTASDLAGARVVSERSPLLGAGILTRVLNDEAEEVAEGGGRAGRPSGPGGAGGRGGAGPGGAGPRGAAETADASAGEMVTLDAERRARLVQFVEANTRMPDQAKARMLAQLSGDQVPAQLIAQLESRMGG